jgi:hypothetical protein
MKSLDIVALTYPVVPVVPLTVKLISELVPLKDNAETVLFDSMEKLFGVGDGAVDGEDRKSVV